MTRRMAAACRALAAGLLLAGCQTSGDPALGITTGESRAEAEFERVRANRDFRIDRAGPDRLRLIARARPVVIEPVAGLCIGEDAVELTGSGVFAAISGCPGPEAGAAKGFPGLVTVSVAAGRMLDPGPGRRRDLRRMRDFLGTVPGRAMLARGDGGPAVRLMEAKAIDEALYVHVREAAGGGAPLFAPDFWRALVEVNARLVLVTVSAFAGGGLDDRDMLAVLAAQVVRLKAANGQKPHADERRLARAVAAMLTGEDAGAEPIQRRAARDAPERAVPVPVPRPGGAGGASPAPPDAPIVPERPRRGV